MAVDVLAGHAAATPDKPALIDDRQDGTHIALTFAEFNAETNRLANVLIERGVRRNDKVVWCGLNSIGVARILHAARKVGATAVPLNYRFSAEEAAYVVDHCDAVAVYADAEFAELFERIRPGIEKVRDVLIFDGPPRAGQLDCDALCRDAATSEPVQPETSEAASTMIYTSGTTGRPKGALRTGVGSPDQARRLLALIGYRPDDIFLTTGPLYHSGPGGFMSIAHSLGNTVIVQRRFDAEDWLRLVDRYRVTTTFTAPAPIRMVCNLNASTKASYDRSSIARLIANAAPWSYALKLAYLADFPEDSLWEVYGSTELGVNTVLEPADQRRKKGSCGRPSPGVEIRLLDDDGKQVSEPGMPGELFVRSKTVFNAYYKQQDKYDEDRRGDWHTVGDVAYFDEEGFYFICDRKKDMIISGGMNIYPAEIEAALEHHPAIRDVAVFGIPSEDWGEAVHAVVVLHSDGTLGAEQITAYAREHLASYKIPRSISFATEIPRTGSGKILKRVLREPYWKGHDSNLV